MPALLDGIAYSCVQPEVNLKVSPVELSAHENHVEMHFTRHAVSSDDPAIERQCLLFNERVGEFIARQKDSLLLRLPGVNPALVADTSALIPRYEFWVSDTLFRAIFFYFRARFLIYTYEGGADGMTRFHAFNYDTREQKFMDNTLLLDYTRKTGVEKLLKARLDDKEGCFTESPTLDHSTVINFSADGMIFSYPPYELGPYVCGAAEINVPLKELGKAVKPRL